MRILLQSNAPWAANSYGNLARNLLPRWRAMGHEVACFAFNGLYSGQLTLDGIPIYPLGRELWGRDKMVYYNKLFRADIYVTFLDVWVVPEISDMDLRWVPYCPVDHEPCPDAIAHALRGAYRIASMSKSGQFMLKARNIDSVPIYCGIDPTVFKPTDDKAAMKNRLGFKGTDFVLGIVAMNKGTRKNFQDMFEIFAHVSKKHANAKLYLHSDPTRPDGMDLRKMAKFFRITNQMSTPDAHMLDMGLPLERLAEIYQAFDVTLMTTGGEGFGMPIIESQACGVPVITNDFTTGRELNACPEFVIKPMKLVLDNMMAYQAITDVGQAVEAVEEIYRTGSEKYRQRCLDFSKQFHWDTVVKDWHKFFAEIERDQGSIGRTGGS